MNILSSEKLDYYENVQILINLAIILPSASLGVMIDHGITEYTLYRSDLIKSLLKREQIVVSLKKITDASTIGAIFRQT